MKPLDNKACTYCEVKYVCLRKVGSVSEGDNKGMKLLYLNTTTVCNNKKCVMFCDISKVDTWEKVEDPDRLDVLWTQEMVANKRERKTKPESIESNEENREDD